MILEIFMNLVLAILRFIFLPENISHLPAKFASVLGTIIAYMIDGFRILNAFIDEVYISALLGFVIFIEGVSTLYHVVMWALRKIPFISVD